MRGPSSAFPVEFIFNWVLAPAAVIDEEAFWAVPGVDVPLTADAVAEVVVMTFCLSLAKSEVQRQGKEERKDAAGSARSALAAGAHDGGELRTQLRTSDRARWTEDD